MSANTMSHFINKPEVVTIVLKNPYEKQKRQIRCIYCGGWLQNTYKQVAVIIAGSPADETQITSEQKCGKCNTQYEFC